MNNNEILHPGEILVYELDARGEDPIAFAVRIGMFPSDFLDLLNSKESVTADIAQRLEKELNISAQFWLDLQADYDLRKV